MDLGAFSISLSVRDLTRAESFYAKLGFATLGGDAAQGWLILRNGDCTLGLFQGMFEGNMLTFNPGWNSDTSQKDGFEDVRSLQAKLEADGVAIVQPVTSETGPGSFVIKDSDGNTILIDQHV